MDPRPADREPDSGAGADAALRRLEERLAKASEAAERLVAEAAGPVGRAAGSAASAAAGGATESTASGGATGSTAAGGGMNGPPPAGWQQPAPDAAAARGTGDLELLWQILGSVRELIPPDLQRRLADALRELLMAMRALIDWYLERTDRKRSAPAEVEDIPIL